MKREDGREYNQLRNVKITTNYIMHPKGSCLIEFGNTKVICTATVTDTKGSSAHQRALGR